MIKWTKLQYIIIFNIKTTRNKNDFSPRRTIRITHRSQKDLKQP